MNIYLKRSLQAIGIVALLVVIYLLVKPSGGEVNTQELTAVSDTDPAPTVGLQAGNLPPDIPLIAMDGTETMLSDLKGKKVFLNFWASWCKPCTLEMPHIQEMQEKYGEDLEIVAVNSAEPKNTVSRFLEKNPYTFPIYLDESGSISGGTYRLLALPTSYFIDEEGVIQTRVEGNLTLEMMEAYYKEL